jgi:hypothetical protein
VWYLDLQAHQKAIPSIYGQIVLSGLVIVAMAIVQEKKLVVEIKKTAKTGKEVSLKLWEICSYLSSPSKVLTIDDLDL